MQYILHARYMSLGNIRDGVTHGTQPRPAINTSPFNVPGNSVAYFPSLLRCGKKREAALGGNTIDVARQNGITYFNSSGGIYLGGDNDGMSGSIETPNNNKQAVNRAAQFMGKDYALIGDKVYVYNEETESWDVSLDLPVKDGTKSNSTGLYAIVDGDIPKLIACYETTINTAGQIWYAVELNGLTETWSIQSGPSIEIDDSKGGIVAEILHGNKLYFTTPNGSLNEITEIGWYDWSKKIFGTIVSQLIFEDTPRMPVDFASFNNYLYMVARDGGNGLGTIRSTPTVYQVTNNSILRAASIPVSGPPVLDGEGQALSQTGNNEGRPLLLVDNVFDKTNPTLWAYYIVRGALSSPNFSGSQYGLSFGAWKAAGTTPNLTYNLPAGTRGGNTTDGEGIFVGRPYSFMQDSEKTGSYGERKDDGTVMRCYVDQSHRELGVTINANDLEIGRTAIRTTLRYSTYCDGTSIPEGGGQFRNLGGGGDFLNMSMHTWQGSGNAPDHITRKRGVSWADTGWTAREHRHRAFPHDKMGGGLRQSPVDSNGFKLIDIVPRGVTNIAPSGNVRINYSLITTSGTPNGTNVFVKAHFDKFLHAPETPCTLVATSHGSLSGDFVAANIVADSGTLYYIEWAAENDGVDLNQAYNLNITVSTTGNDATGDISAITDPNDIAGCVLWLDADDAATIAVDANGVSAWSDKSDTNSVSGVVQSDNANKPSVTAAANNGRDAITFNGSTDFMFASGEISQGDQTVFIVFETNSSSADQYMFSLSSDVPDITYLSGSPVSGVYQYDHNHFSEYVSPNLVYGEAQDFTRTLLGSGSRTINDGVAGVSVAHLVVHSETDFEPSIRLNDEPLTSIDSIDDEASPTGLANISVGRFSGAQQSGIYPAAGNYFSGNIYEIAVYNSKLVSGQIEAFYKYVDNKWSIG